MGSGESATGVAWLPCPGGGDNSGREHGGVSTIRGVDVILQVVGVDEVKINQHCMCGVQLVTSEL